MRATRQKSGRRYSRKAQALHRDYVYLRVMRETTDLRCGELGSSVGLDPKAITTWLCRPLWFLDRLNMPEDWLQESDPRCSIDDSACEFVYGIPLQLLILVSKASELIRRKRAFTRYYPGLVAPALFLSMCDNLELEILNWPVDRTVKEICELPISEVSQSLITHQTRAFHQAVIIYFSRLVRGVHRQLLQPYAASIIDHLEAITHIKQHSAVTTGSISWPGFIGAAESVDEQLRSRYLTWSRSIRFYNLGVYERANDVISEVWEREKADEGLAPGCSWAAIIEAKDIRLLLH